MLLDLPQKIFEREKMPEEWRDSVIVPIFKEKGDIQDCGDCRGITMISHTMQILFFLWFPLCRGEAGLFVTPMYGYFCNSFPLVPVVGLFSQFFFLLCISQVSLHTILPS